MPKKSFDAATHQLNSTFDKTEEEGRIPMMDNILLTLILKEESDFDC